MDGNNVDGEGGYKTISIRQVHGPEKNHPEQWEAFVK